MDIKYHINIQISSLDFDLYGNYTKRLTRMSFSSNSKSKSEKIVKKLSVQEKATQSERQQITYNLRKRCSKLEHTVSVPGPLLQEECTQNAGEILFVKSYSIRKAHFLFHNIFHLHL